MHAFYPYRLLKTLLGIMFQIVHVSVCRVPYRLFAIQVRECVYLHAISLCVTEDIGPMQNSMNNSIEHVILCFWLFYTHFFSFFILYHSFTLWMNSTTSNRMEQCLYIWIAYKRKEKKILPACVYNFSSTRFLYYSIHFLLSLCIFDQAHLVISSLYHFLIFIYVHMLKNIGRHIWRIIFSLSWWMKFLAIWY